MKKAKDQDRRVCRACEAFPCSRQRRAIRFREMAVRDLCARSRWVIVYDLIQNARRRPMRGVMFESGLGV